ncbi:MAG: flavodoxin domain-containing protein [Deltaproteobacteria bacterium]|nr:flavodoxin domain-containing protein [Deltaproteobacteria bacterium]
MIDGSMLVGGAAVMMAVGGGLLSPQDAEAGNLTFPESSCGRGKGACKRVLVTYASYCGTTGGVAEAIAQVLCERGAGVDVSLVRNVNDIASYEAVVIGSAVRSGSWWPEAIEFVERNREGLSRIPVAYFLTCLALHQDTETTRRIARGYMDPALKAAPGIRPVVMGYFAGALDYSKLNFVYRMVMKSKMEKRGVPEGDFRDWGAIRSWAGGLCGPLLSEQS